MHLARDCEHPERMGDPMASNTGLPRIRNCEVSRDHNFNISSVDVGVNIAEGSKTRHFTVTFRRTADGIELSRAGQEHNRRDGEAVRFLLTAILGATEAVNRSDTFPTVQPVAETLAEEIEAREPTNGWEVVDE